MATEIEVRDALNDLEKPEFDRLLCHASTRISKDNSPEAIVQQAEYMALCEEYLQWDTMEVPHIEDFIRHIIDKLTTPDSSQKVNCDQLSDKKILFYLDKIAVDHEYFYEKTPLSTLTQVKKELEKFTKADWNKFLFYAMKRCQKCGIPAKKSPDFVQEVLEKVLSGVRKWRPRKVNIKGLIFGAIHSLIRPDATRGYGNKDEKEPPEPIWEDVYSDSLLREKILACLQDDEALYSLVLLELAGIPMADFNKIKPMLRQRLRVLKDSLEISTRYVEMEGQGLCLSLKWETFPTRSPRPLLVAEYQQQGESSVVLKKLKWSIWEADKYQAQLCIPSSEINHSITNPVVVLLWYKQKNSLLFCVRQEGGINELVSAWVSCLNGKDANIF